MKLLDIFGEVAGEIFDRHFTPDRCVNATRVTLEVMRKLKVPAFPLVTHAYVVNDAFVQRAHELQRLPQGREEVEEWFEANGSHSVGVGFGADDRPNRYPGHLLAIVRGILVDPSAGQMTRPKHNIIVPSVIVLDNVTPEFLQGREDIGMNLPTGGALTYRAFPTDKSFEDVPGFKHHSDNRRVTDEIIAAIRRRM